MNSTTFHSQLDEADRERAAALYFEAFRQKLGPLLGSRCEELLAETFHLDRALTARRGTELVGLAGLHYDGRALVGLEWPDIRRTYGLLSGVLRFMGLALLDRSPKEGELLMDGIVVAREARGQGIGSELLRRVEGFARDRGFRQVRLDVVDTNPGARRLYERHGFEEVVTESLPWLRRPFGFGASTTMVKRLQASPAS